ncbi:C40 family peptidase [Synechococcus sp. CCY 9618]|uniref:C40 family peptidase n=1 Tax=Synechococcus sp. CCY 9618 TaxID=2815602 RepID=UPI001C217A6C|nr:C40 family peptidase [Synechococcus sp. CCY 9618]
MATLGTLPAPGSCWALTQPLEAYSRPVGPGLATQVRAGRHLKVLTAAGAPSAAGVSKRLRVRLHEDGYPCWVESDELEARACPARPPSLARLDRSRIVARLEEVLAWAEAARHQPNRYLWGGTLGPDFDCSGLVQTAFARAGIWLPRDAYLQERFCRPVAVRSGITSLLAPGDLIFFGTSRRCTHVGLHLGGGRYLHSSGRQHGRDGIGIDDIHPHNRDPVASHYRAELRGAGRVMHSHDGSPLPP